MTYDDEFGVDDIVCGPIAESLGEGILPTHAVLIVQTIDTDGPGLRYLRSEGTTAWHAMGMLHSTLNRIEADDLDGWGTDEGE